MKKFSNSYFNDYPVLLKAVVGFELEFYSDKSYYKLLEYLNRELAPIEVKGFKKYHSEYKPDRFHFKLEPDYSLGTEGCELITGPLPYVDSKIILLKLLKGIQQYGETDEKCGIHINISFDNSASGKTIENVNPLKIILDTDEDYVYSKFPNRKNNIYAKSVKQIVPFKSFDFSKNALDIIKNNLELPETKYYGINIKNVYKGRLEFRYLGGSGYENKTSEILELMDYFIILSWNSINPELDDKNINDLEDYLHDNITNYKKFQTLENFLSEYPSINLQVDKKEDNIIVKTYYPRFYELLYELMRNVYNLSDCIINYNTSLNRLEIVEGEIQLIFDIKNIDFINCVITNGTLYKCNIVETEVKNAHIHNSNIISSVIHNNKIEDSKIDSLSSVINCYLENCFLDGEMNGGVFRSGKIGENGRIDSNVELITKDKSFFHIKQVQDKEKMKIDKNKIIK